MSFNGRDKKWTQLNIIFYCSFRFNNFYTEAKSIQLADEQRLQEYLHGQMHKGSIETSRPSEECPPETVWAFTTSSLVNWFSSEVVLRGTEHESLASRPSQISLFSNEVQFFDQPRETPAWVGNCIPLYIRVLSPSFDPTLSTGRPIENGTPLVVPQAAFLAYHAAGKCEWLDKFAMAK